MASRRGRKGRKGRTGEDEGSAIEWRRERSLPLALVSPCRKSQHKRGTPVKGPLDRVIEIAVQDLKKRISRNSASPFLGLLRKVSHHAHRENPACLEAGIHPG